MKRLWHLVQPARTVGQGERELEQRAYNETAATACIDHTQWPGGRQELGIELGVSASCDTSQAMAFRDRELRLNGSCYEFI